MKTLWIALITCFISVGCGSTKGITPLKNGKYFIESIGGQPVEHTAYIQLNRDKDIVSGEASCNSFSAPMQSDKNTITIGTLTSTKKFCQGKMEEERKLMSTLGKVERFQYKEGRLILASKSGKTLITTQKPKT